MNSKPQKRKREIKMSDQTCEVCEKDYNQVVNVMGDMVCYKCLYEEAAEQLRTARKDQDQIKPDQTYINSLKEEVFVLQGVRSLAEKCQGELEKAQSQIEVLELKNKSQATTIQYYIVDNSPRINSGDS